MNILWGIVLSICAVVLILVYGRYQYMQGCKDAFEEATRMLQEQIDKVEGEKK